MAHIVFSVSCVDSRVIHIEKFACSTQKGCTHESIQIVCQRRLEKIQISGREDGSSFLVFLVLPLKRGWYFGAFLLDSTVCVCLSSLIDRKDGPQIIRLPRRI